MTDKFTFLLICYVYIRKVYHNLKFTLLLTLYCLNIHEQGNYSTLILYVL